ncbi:pterin-4-alpha-carbinolamine dehydratase [Caldithrix abyssi DSM 13497]|uniref:Putative pterin-4-alpha-carbinolamine dehydratase n=1 Tax=Caldithrix abyssi DSM 13497 TaxID=880073 RepID=H1XT24_CALAY|nr:4a-hydroxytetrahydrobiopterin dehydratase [Caldithrix abyssi]APF17338.1 4a-hydroxytetrahydrobiopterin dehydratase [Caldithrix abyssi DSM 13497]EHO41453.1 pterin-4-alpha-carbinolamine dehydratase [Caldithrix abyssi DSM 13497]
MEKLRKEEAQDLIKRLKNWKLQDEQISAQWQFTDFTEAMVFINKVAILAERHGHHPEIFNVYNRVRLTLTTHDAGGLTQKDFDLAMAIDELLS